MTSYQNEYGQAVGFPVEHWVPRPGPGRIVITGRYCRLEPVNVERHARDLFEAYSAAPDGRDWTYMPVGPFSTLEAYAEHAGRIALSNDPLHYTIIDLKTGKAVGTLSLMRIDAANGVIEVGYVAYSPLVKRTPVGSEAQYLLMRYAFDELGYRRYEWKCHALNEPSRRAAARYGFEFEGVFRQASVVKGRNRDTAWYSILDSEWPSIRAGFEQWLSPENFDAEGRQKTPLAKLIAQKRNPG